VNQAEADLPWNNASSRVRLRPWQRQDTLAQESWPRYNDPFHTLWNLPRDQDSSFYDEIFHNTSPIPRRIWAIEDRHRRLIGRISLRDIDQHARRARLGISLGAPYVGQGLGTEALILFLDYFFGQYAFLAMLLDVAAFNQRAVRCYENLGFRHVGSDWRSAGRDISLQRLNDPRYQDLQPFFRRNERSTLVQFYEMELHRDDWRTRRDIAWNKAQS
jgi:RimJ/RimL family protein N-acetyltransferase